MNGPRSSGYRRGESGAALLLVLTCALLLAALGAGLVSLGNIEGLAAANMRAGEDVLHVAEAATDHALAVIGGASAEDVLSGARQSPVRAGSGTVLTAWGEQVDLVALTSALQARTDAEVAVGPNRPTWRLFSAGDEGAFVGDASDRPGAFAAVWVADDPADADDNPSADRNGVLLLRALALHPTGLRRGVRLAIRMTGTSVEVLSWRESPPP